jgi:hypothetical protein
MQDDFYRNVDVGLESKQIVQVDQRFVYHKPVRTRDKLWGHLDIESVDERGDRLGHLAGVTVAFGGAAVKSRGESSTMGPWGTLTTSIPTGGLLFRHGYTNLQMLAQSRGVERGHACRGPRTAGRSNRSHAPW